jgi:tRNA(Ile2) C34 agmatinyltransferase TiaS
MKKEDLITLDHLLTMYSNEEFAKSVVAVCHSITNAEVQNIINYLQKETGSGTVRTCSSCGGNMFDNGNNFRCGKCGKRVYL